LIQFFAHKQRQNKIVNGQMRFADEISQSRGTPQATRSVDQSSHSARLRAAKERRKRGSASSDEWH
jgi:hypothetical protein